MQVSNISPVNFQAKIGRKLENKLFYEANALGKKTFEKFNTQKENIEKWGMNSSILTLIETETKEGFVQRFTLVNNVIAPVKKFFFESKKSLLETFLSIKEQDITEAENQLKKLP